MLKFIISFFKTERFINLAKNILVYHLSNIVWTHLLRLFVDYNLQILSIKNKYKILIDLI